LAAESPYTLLLDRQNRVWARKARKLLGRLPRA
jgi:hypothetical protein